MLKVCFLSASPKWSFYASYVLEILISSGEFHAIQTETTIEMSIPIVNIKQVREQKVHKHKTNQVIKHTIIT